jgi:NADPH:quinone reductase-like Zn-dependent oxidoreductase
MKAARIQSFGGSEQVKIEEVPIPSIQKGEALIEVHAAAVNPVDWMIREKIYNPSGADRVPMTLGQDFAGIIKKIAPETNTSFREGDEVFGETWGAFSEFVAVPLKDLVKKPKSLDFVSAASIPMPALTAWQVVIDTARATPDKKFLIHGASGGVGSFAAQFALWKGADVIATASQPSFNSLKKMGITHIIDYQKERFEEKIKGIDVVIDPLGGETQARSWQVLKKGGMLINLIGEIDEITAKRFGVRAVEFGMEYRVSDLEKITKLIEQGFIQLHISKVLPLEQARDALDLNQRGQSHGKIVLKVA